MNKRREKFMIMMKRSNPFGECSPLQLKTRIGKKEIDLGVAQDENMKVVYEKTKELLFKGSQKSFAVSHTDANDNILGETILTEKPVEEIQPGQLCLDKGCQLTVPGFSNDLQKVSSLNKDVSLTCKTCKGSVTKSTSHPCSFCDKPICWSCSKQCDSCAGNFCHLCSVLNYDETMERSFCLNCS